MTHVKHQVIFQRRPHGVPTAFFRMLCGENDGKQLVRLVNEEAGE